MGLKVTGVGFAAPDPFTVRLNAEDGECTLRRSNADLAAEVACLLAQSVPQKEIAARLGTSEATVSRAKRQISPRTRGETGSVGNRIKSKTFTETGTETREIALAAPSAGHPSAGTGLDSDFTEGGIMGEIGES